MTPEGAIKQQIIAWLEAKEIFHYVHIVARVPGNRGSMKKGVSDIIGCLPNGRFLAIEVKAPMGSVSDEQMEFIFDVRKNGGIAFVARSVEDVVKQLKEVA